MLGIELRSFWKIFNNINDTICFIKHYDFDIFQLNNRISFNELTDENRKYLSDKNFIYHINETDLSNEYKFLRNNTFNINIIHSNINPNKLQIGFNKLLIENLDKYYNGFDYFDEWINTNSICFDISHAISIGFDFKNIKVLKNKIELFHLSNYNEKYEGEHKCHTAFYDDPDNRLEEILSEIKLNNLIDLNFIMEYNFDNLNDFDKEYEYLKNIFEVYK